jgi:hypothetical protein
LLLLLRLPCLLLLPAATTCRCSIIVRA